MQIGQFHQCFIISTVFKLFSLMIFRSHLIFIGSPPTMFLLSLLHLRLSTIPSILASEAEFGYRGSDCPSLWYRKYPQCGTEDTTLKSRYLQSPIDLTDAVFNSSLKPLNLRNYRISLGKWKMQKSMTGLRLLVEGSLPFIEIPQAYEFQEAHFHWGTGGRSKVGSEHSVNGKFYPLEAHLVHKDRRTGHIAVIAVFYDYSENPKNDKDNEKLDPIFEALEGDVNGRFYSQSGGTPVLYLKEKFLLENFLPENGVNSYYKYMGSLTVPPCTSVIWMIIKPIGHISRRQLYLLERVQQCNTRVKTCYPRTSIGPNIRPIQPRNNRVIEFYSISAGITNVPPVFIKSKDWLIFILLTLLLSIIFTT